MERAEAEEIYEQGKDVVVAVLLRMDEQIQRLEKRVAQQGERIAQLERRLDRSSQNSSQPPSADLPGTPPRRGKDPSGRKQGAQPGHEGKGRELLPTVAVDEVIVHWPAECECGHEFGEGELVAVGDPVRHQVEELPRLAVRVTEHQCPRVRCPGCGRRARAALPGDVAASAFGPRFHAAVAVLSVRNRVSRRDVAECCEQLFGARISSGTVDAILDRVADAVVEPDADLLARVRAAQALNMDETGWRTAGQRRALWGAFTDRHAVLRVRTGPRQGASGRRDRDRHVGSLVRLHASATRSPTGLLGTSAPRLQGPRRRARSRKGLRRARPQDLRGAVLKLGDLPAHPRPQRVQAPHPRPAPPVQADPAQLRGQAGPLPLHARDGAQLEFPRFGGHRDPALFRWSRDLGIRRRGWCRWGL